jgi:subtilisin family serine protease
MAKSKKQQNDASGSADGGESGTTGRYLVLFREDQVEAGMQMLSDELGITMVRASEAGTRAVAADSLAGQDVVYETLGVAVVSTPPAQARSLGALAAGESAIIAIEEERIVYAFDEDAPVQSAMPALPLGNGAPALPETPLAGYLRGYQAAVDHLVRELMARSEATAGAAPVAEAVDESLVTWGLRATKVAASRYSGKDVRVAVLDTGFDFDHPDFVGRRITAQSFIKGEKADDGHGHGTHCIGTACGPQRPGQLPRYGIAYEAEIFVGKVLSNAGRGSDGGILAGVDWAIRNRCPVVSMSLGAPTQIGQAYSQVFEAAARRALAAGTLIVAAAGNESRRPDTIAPVGHPANCPSILAVAAINAQGEVAYFSCGGRNLDGGQVDIAGPGVAVRSSWPRPTLYRTISGTSMATPHVAGIAALYAEANPGVRGGALGWLLLQSAERLALPTRDVGAGLVQAP